MTEGAAAAMPLAGRHVGISVSESDDLEALGFLPPEKPDDLPPDLQRVLSEVCVALVAAGAKIVYGGDMRPGGFTLQLMREAAEAYRVAELDSAEPVFINVLAGPVWRKESSETIFNQIRSFGELGRMDLMLPDGERIELRARFETKRQNIAPKCIVEVNGARVGLNESVESAAALERLLAPALTGPKPDLVQSLTAMRRAMAAGEVARIVIGGRVRSYADDRPDGRPGIPEEALETLRAGKLLLPVASFGGAAHDVAEALGLLPAGPLVKHSDVGPNYWEMVAEIREFANSQPQRFLAVPQQIALKLASTDVPSRVAALISRALLQCC